MSEKRFSVTNLKTAQQRQFDDAVNSTLKINLTNTDGGYEYLHSGLDDYDKSLFGREGAILELVRGRFKKNNIVHILILGCGSGQAARDITNKLSPQEQSRIIIDEIGAADIRNKSETDFDDSHNINFINGDISIKNLGREKYDLALSRMTFIHLIDPLRILKKVDTALKEKGEFFSDFTIYEFASKFGQVSETQLYDYLLRLNKTNREIFIDQTGTHLRKGKSALKFDGLRYKEDNKGRINYEII